ncbi:hypothetical protein BMT54_08540 [Pasteurellaceae bacterium 15-036681]|nr:hypothetical protein BMT54_08540 [Pasteurellaceae bacterium 15-036681]
MNLKKLAILTGTMALAMQAFAADQYQHIRNATAKMEYAGQTFLIDPFFAPKESLPGFEGSFNSHNRMPLVDLPQSTDEILKDVNAVIVTHTHLDHWDEAAQKAISKELPIFVQHEADEKLIRSQGFKNVQVINGTAEFNGVKLHKTGGAHGTTEMYANPQLAALLGDAMGVVFQKDGHKTTYIMGDTLWTADVNKALNSYKPEVLVMNTGYARINGIPEGIIMGVYDVLKAYQVAPQAKIITVHMDTVNHTAVSRADMRAFLKGENIKENERVFVPNDGEVVKLD